MLGRMSSEQFTEWQAFWLVEPWGEYREDWRMANLLAFIANSLRGKEQAPMNPQQFLSMLDPTGETEPPLTAEEEAAAAFEANWQAMLGEE